VLWADPPTWTDYDAYKTTEENFAYDGLYRLTDADDDDTEVTLVWNALDQVTQEKQKIKTGGSWTTEKTVASGWDDTGKRRSSATYPISGKTFGFLYDALDRMTTLQLNGTPAKPMASYGYEGPGGRVVRRDRAVDLSATGFGTIQHRAYFSYDALERLTKIEHKKATRVLADWIETVERNLDSTWGNGSSGRIWQRGSYDIADSASTLVTHDYAYDKVGRLVEDKRQVGGGALEDFDYTQEATQFLKERKKDGTAEITYTEATDGSLQMASYNDGSTATLTHDVCGNVSSRTQSGSTTSYYYDHENRLVHIDAATDFWFRYDALGRRVEEKEGTAVKLFWYDGVHIAEETNGATPNAALQRLSLFGPQIDEVLYSGALDGSQNLTDHRWPLADHLGSVLVVVDNGGTVKTDFNYTTAYGETTRTGAESYPYGFTGRRWIETAKVYDYRTRAYDPKLGRFLQRDSIGVWGDGGSLGNGYGYVVNDPQNNVDPFGFEVWIMAPCSLVDVEVDEIEEGQWLPESLTCQCVWTCKCPLWSAPAPGQDTVEGTNSTIVWVLEDWDPAEEDPVHRCIRECEESPVFILCVVPDEPHRIPEDAMEDARRSRSNEDEFEVELGADAPKSL
jgi:RHS repeat-associated protein